MKIESYETEFSVEDVVWLMYQNKPTRGIVYAVHFELTEKANLSWSDMCVNIIRHLKSYFDEHRFEKNVWYEVQKVNEDDTYYGVGMFGRLTADDIFHTKEELLRSL